MLNSSKPLEDKYWFTPEEIEKITSNHVISIMREHKELNDLEDDDF